MKLKKATIVFLILVFAVSFAAALSACDQQFNVDFVMDGQIVSVSVKSGEKVTPPDEFRGGVWYKDKDFTDKWDPDTVITQDCMLYGRMEYTVAQAKALCPTDGSESAERYLIRAKVKQIVNPQYGEMVIFDDTGEMPVYGTRGADGKTYYDQLEDKPYAGDEVLLSCTLKLFKGEPEVYVGWILEVKHNQVENEKNENDYSQMTVAQARQAQEGALIKTSGVVSQIIYATGKIPCGFILIDSTSSIYVYDRQIAARVKIGNTVTILGEKAYYVLEDEKTAAEQFGYKGCNQLTDVVLKSNDEKTDGKFETSWIQDSTVKDIVDTPVSEDISALVYKVNALIQKDAGTGFINYRIKDIDGVTGSYVYTMCNGGDFAWLDEFDDKICTVYLTAFNAKSEKSGCFWRFIPVSVAYENYSFDVKNAPDYAIKYHAVGQILPEYGLGKGENGAAPAEVTLPDALITSVSSQLLGFENVTISYVSKNENVVAITMDGSEPHLTLKSVGEATITIKAVHGQNSAEKDVKVTVKSAEEVKTITVAEAIAAGDGEKIAVKGIVGASLVNQPVGFYLIDETGVIAVKTTKETLAKVKLGNEVVVTGTRTHRTKGSDKYFGQTLIDNCDVQVTDYGVHEYSTESFDKDKTLADIDQLAKDAAATDDLTTTVYKITVTVEEVKTQFSSNIYVKHGETQIMLYCSGSSQYSWLKALAADGKEITIDFALCDWNTKGYKGAVLAVYNDDETKTVNPLYFA